MEIKNGTLILEEASGIEGYDSGDYMSYTDSSGNKVLVPVRTLIRLNSILQFDLERKGFDFEKFCRFVIGVRSDET